MPTEAAPVPTQTPSSGTGGTRILMYTAYFAPEYSGAALQALTLAKALRRRGHHVEFVTNRWPGMSERAEVEGFAVQRLQPGRMRKHRELRLWLNLARYLWRRRRDFDILHSHGAYFTNAFVGPLARVLGLKSVIKASLAADDLVDLSRPLLGRAHRAMLSRVDACVAISGDLVEEFRTGGIAPHRTHHIPNGVDTERFGPPTPAQRLACRDALGLPADRPVVIYVGVLDQRKNILWLARQWLQHDAFGTGALLVAVGPQARDDRQGAIRGQLAQLAAENPQRFALRDFEADICRWYHAADLLILPSEKEGLPNVVLEAMACGLPCVAARTSGSSELVVDGLTGHTYAPGDVAGMGEAVRRCLGANAANLGGMARSLSERRFAIGVVAQQYEAIYMRLMRSPKRVLYFENGIGYGGAIICLRHLVRNLDRTQYEPMVVTGLGDEKYQDIATEARWQHIPDRRLDVSAMKRALAASSWPNVVPGARWLLNQALARMDDAVNFVPSFLQTMLTVMRFRPALIHVNNEPLCNRAALLAGKLMRVPVVSHVRGDQQGSMLMHSAYRLPDYFIAVSRWVSDSIGRLGVPADRRTYIYDGIELDKLDLQADGSIFRRDNALPPQAFVVGLVGLVIPWKGQQLFLEAARRLSKSMPDAVFAIVGGTPDEFGYFEDELRQLAAQPELQGRVVFTGHVRDMARVYNGLDVVLSASTSPEPLGTMIIEAMTMARPIIAPDHGGAIEMIEDGRTGLLFKAGNADDLAAKIVQLHGDKALGEQLGKAARTEALKTFAVREHALQVQSVYEQVLGAG